MISILYMYRKSFIKRNIRIGISFASEGGKDKLMYTGRILVSYACQNNSLSVISTSCKRGSESLVDTTLKDLQTACNRGFYALSIKSKMLHGDQASLGVSRHRSLHSPTSNSGTNETGG